MFLKPTICDLTGTSSWARYCAGDRFFLCDLEPMNLRVTNGVREAVHLNEFYVGCAFVEI